MGMGMLMGLVDGHCNGHGDGHGLGLEYSIAVGHWVMKGLGIRKSTLSFAKKKIIFVRVG